MKLLIDMGHPAHVHTLLSYSSGYAGDSSGYVGEGATMAKGTIMAKGATMAKEAAVLGVPSTYVSPIKGLPPSTNW